MFLSDKPLTFVFCNFVGFGDVVGVDDGVRPFVLFFCLSWFQKKEKKPEPRPVYDDELEDDEDEENVLDSVAVPPPGFSTRKLKPLGDRSQPEPDHLVLRQLTP
ncbi:hypothetical protein BDR07DRAFT_1386573 [Suillus spraguei]|nr:hypothetical protein BDR07DRAFT_1386573 [Suillus spraguei]